MKVIVISDVTPTPENVGGASALPFHLLVHREPNISISIYSYNNNHIEKEENEKLEKALNCNLNILRQPVWIRLILRLKLSFIRIFLPFPIYNYIKLDKEHIRSINLEKPDGILIYGQENSRIERQLTKYKICHLLPDCQSLYYYRMIGQRFVFTNYASFFKNIVMYKKYLRMEKEYVHFNNVQYLLVGKADTDFITKNNNSIHASFIRHPHYNIAPQFTNSHSQFTIKFHSPKIKLLIAGQYNQYMKQEADELLEELKNSRIEELKRKYTFTFLGRGWKKHVEGLRKAGYKVNHITFAPDYIEEIAKHDIQVTPISIGTGTKGKVLDALANGLLVIGTPYALENIAVKHGESCIEYKKPKEVIDVLLDIPKETGKYERMAAEGQQEVLTQHSRKHISKELFSFLSNVKNG